MICRVFVHIPTSRASGYSLACLLKVSGIEAVAASLHASAIFRIIVREIYEIFRKSAN